MIITIHPNPLTQERRNDPKRRAEMFVLDQLAASVRVGTACYEWSAGPGSPEVDFPVWVQDLGRFAIQVKGGHYTIHNFNWFLSAPDGSVEPKTSPVFQTWDGAMSVRRVVEAVTGFQVYIIPVLVFPDMEPDAHMTALAAHKKVYLVWRGEDLTARLEEIAATEGVRRPPICDHIKNEFHAIMYGERLGTVAPVRRPTPEIMTPMIPTRMELGGATLAINNYGPLIIHAGTAQDLTEFLESAMSVSSTNPDPHQPAVVSDEPWQLTVRDGDEALHQPPQPPMLPQP